MELSSSRRQFLSTVGAGLLGATLKANELPVQDEALDEVFSELQRAEPQALQGLSTHAPMATEALCVLGYPHEAGPWLKKYRAPKQTLPSATTPINPARWQEALGPRRDTRNWEQANHRWADWKEYFTRELANRPWRDVLNTWVPRLAPGMSGAATHGIIRTAHAARALGRKETSVRQGELARGLAYWASSYEKLPAKDRQQPGLVSFADALNEVPLYKDAFGQLPQGRNIVEVIRQVAKLEKFAEVRDLVAQPKDVQAGLSALTATFTRVYLRYGTQRNAIAFIHAVTGPTSLRRLAPFIKPETALAAFPFAWQTAAAIFCTYVPQREEFRQEETKLKPAELAERAVKNGDEHAIKFTEVMLSEYQLNPDPIYLAAAEEASQRQ